jgi:hypothetical protein
MLRLTYSLVGLTLLACAEPASGPPASTPAESAATNTAPVTFSLPSNEGALVSVPLAGSRTTVLDFFGPTCEPCAKKVPELVRRRAEIEAHGAKLVLVAVLADTESTADAEGALARWGAPTAFLVDKGDVSRREAGISALPSTLVVGADGRVRWRAPPKASADDVISAIR